MAQKKRKMHPNSLKNLQSADKWDDKKRFENGLKSSSHTNALLAHRKTLGEYAQGIASTTKTITDPKTGKERKLTNAEISVIALFNRVQSGDMAAFKEWRSLLGESEAQQIKISANVSNATPADIDDVDSLNALRKELMDVGQ